MKNLTKERGKINITAEDWLNAQKILVTLQNITRNGYTSFNVFILTPNGEIRKVCGGPHWSEEKGYYHLTGWGFNRAFMLVYNLTMDLMGFNENLFYEKISKKVEYLFI